MKLTELAKLKGFMREDWDRMEVTALRMEAGARADSKESGWAVEINGELIGSARAQVRIFASLDTIREELRKVGITRFYIDAKAQPKSAPQPAGAPKVDRIVVRKGAGKAEAAKPEAIEAGKAEAR